MSRILSHSAVNLYQTCGQKFNLHYNHKYREKVNSAALIFGSALDAAINAILEDKKKDKLHALGYYETWFESHWKTATVNNKKIEDLSKSTLIVYAEADFDEDLLDSKDKIFLSEYTLDKFSYNPTASQVFSLYEELNKKKKESGIAKLHEKELGYLNLANWLSLRHKGLLMIKAYYEEVLPKITKVYEVQRKVEVSLETGDKFLGFIDAVLDFGQGPVITDLKTSARPYDEDAANSSPQLAIYTQVLKEEYNTNKTLFVVLKKAIKKNRSKICSSCKHNGSESRAKTCDNTIAGKRCGAAWIETVNPAAEVQWVYGEIPAEFAASVMENYDEVLRGINSNLYIRNFNSCKMPYGNCQFYATCHYGKKLEDDPNLEKVESSFKKGI